MKKNPHLLFASGALVLSTLVACSGDDTATSATDSSSGTAGTTDGTGTTASTTSPTTTATTGNTTSMSGTATMGETTTTSDTGVSVTDSTTVDPTDSTTGPTTTDPTTGSTTVDPTDTDPTTSTTEPCVCTPGEPSGQCVGEALEVCAADCQGYEPQACNDGEVCVEGQCVALLCVPDSKVCADADNYQQCSGDGMSLGNPVACGNTQGCFNGECLELCAAVQDQPSSIGCSFIANRMENYVNGNNDSLVIGNTSKTKTAQVQLYFTPTNSNTEQPQGAPVNVPPGGTYTFTLTNAAIGKVSALRKGGTYRAQSNIPVIAYQHSPLGQVFTNDASMLLPEYALKQNYVISSWIDVHNAYPSYFNVIAVENGTTVQWTPPINTLGGNGVAAVSANQTGMVQMNRFDTLQVRAPNGQDLSGTFVTADKPIWVVGAVGCTNVPNLSCLYCDHIEEQMLPLDYWGKEYVGAHSPDRGSEKHHWRIFAGEDNTVITTEPPQPGTPINIAKKGGFANLTVNNGVSFIFKSDKPFLPIQYLESQTCGGNTGDPAMYQMIPVEQFLSSYAFVTGTNYPLHYVQIIRPVGGADVKVDNVTVTGYYTVGNYEVSDWKISEGSHFAESDTPFGIVGVGYSNATSYAYPGGLRLQVINPQ